MARMHLPLGLSCQRFSSVLHIPPPSPPPRAILREDQEQEGSGGATCLTQSTLICHKCSEHKGEHPPGELTLYVTPLTMIEHGWKGVGKGQGKRIRSWWRGTGNRGRGGGGQMRSFKETWSVRSWVEDTNNELHHNFTFLYNCCR